MRKKFKIVAAVTAVLWLTAFVQICMTRLYVSHNGITQAFARNQLTVTHKSVDSRNVEEGNTCVEGKVSGRLDEAEMRSLAQELFRTMGGGRVLESRLSEDENYYVAYGYTSGIAGRKLVNGRPVNLNVAMSYNEREKCTNVIMGSPVINSDF